MYTYEDSSVLDDLLLVLQNLQNVSGHNLQPERQRLEVKILRIVDSIVDLMDQMVTNQSSEESEE